MADEFTGDQQPTLLPRSGADAAITLGDATRSWDEVERRARMTARALVREGITDGRRWGVLSDNCVEYAELLLGNNRAGSRLVPLNWHLTPHEVAELLTDSQAELVVASPSRLDLARDAASMAGVDRIIVIGDELDDWQTSAGDDLLPERVGGTTMLYTGGTTGRSKGVLRADRGGPTTRWAPAFAAWGSMVRMPDGGRSMLTTPLYHALGGALFSTSLAKGVPVSMTTRFDPAATLALIESDQITSTVMVPTQFIRLLKLDDDVRNAHDLSSLQWILHTAAPCPAWVKRAMIDWLGPVIFEMYGSSEGTGPAICDSHEWLAHPGTVGRGAAHVQYSIVDDDGNDLPTGEVGTIYCRRPEGAPTYHDAPDKTAKMQLPDGRFTVGDLGWMDDDGYLYLADRRVDLIISGGSNIYPAEIEGVLIEHPDVADAAVFGIPHPEFGEEVKAVVEAPAGRTVDVDSVRAFAAERLASYKMPKSIDVTDALPREAHGKLKKRFLRDPYWEGVER